MASRITPIISKIYHDPANMKPSLDKVDAEVNRRYKKFGVELKKIIKRSLKGGKATDGVVSMALFNEDFAINAAQQWDYSFLTASDYARLNQWIAELIDKYILGTTDFDMDYDQFIGYFIEEEAKRGTTGAFNNLAAQSKAYSESQTLQAIFSSQAYQNRLGIALEQSYTDWRAITEQMRGKLGNIIGEAISAGVSPNDLARELVEQGVKPGTARNLARTELIGTYRKARLSEGERAKKDLGIKTGYLWLSALSPTTRSWHASRHGKIYTAAEIQEFYSKNGNRYNCKCSFTEVLLDEDGNPRSKGLLTRMTKQREKWMEYLSAGKVT